MSGELLFILLSLALLVLAFYLDYLQNTRPELFAPKPEKPGPRREPVLFNRIVVIIRRPIDWLKINTLAHLTAGFHQAVQRVQTIRVNRKPKQTPEVDNQGESCRTCATYLREMAGVLTLLAEDAYGSLYQCPECKKLFYLDVNRGTMVEAELAWVRRIFPNVDIE
jgi:hypothetical protein